MAKPSESPRHTLIPAVHLLLFDGDKILLLRRCNTGFCDGCYSVPAGHVEDGESATLALAREAQEEIGIKIQPEDLVFRLVMHRRTPEAQRVDFFFTASRWSGDVVNAEPRKCDDLSWFTCSDLADNMVPYVRAAIDAHLGGYAYAEFGWDQPPDR